MRSPLILSLALTFLSSLAHAVTPESRSTTIFVWPLSASKPSTLAQIAFTPTNASITSYTPFTSSPSSSSSSSEDDAIVRLGFHHHPSDTWSGIATAASNLSADKRKTLILHVRPDGELYHIGLKLSEPVSQGKGKKSQTEDGLVVEVLRIQEGPTPVLNKPIVISAEGEEAKEPEKSFLQKYVEKIMGDCRGRSANLLLQVLVGAGAVFGLPGCDGRCKGVDGLLGGYTRIAVLDEQKLPLQTNKWTNCRETTAGNECLNGIRRRIFCQRNRLAILVEILALFIVHNQHCLSTILLLHSG